MREMIVAPDETGRRRALAKLLPMQREDFEGIFEAMAGQPVTIRLLDPPLHEFLPHGKDELGTLARAMKLPAVRLERLCASLVAADPHLRRPRCTARATHSQSPPTPARAAFVAA